MLKLRGCFRGSGRKNKNREVDMAKRKKKEGLASGGGAGGKGGGAGSYGGEGGDDSASDGMTSRSPLERPRKSSIVRGEEELRSSVVMRGKVFIDYIDAMVMWAEEIRHQAEEIDMITEEIDGRDHELDVAIQESLAEAAWMRMGINLSLNYGGEGSGAGLSISSPKRKMMLMTERLKKKARKKRLLRIARAGSIAFDASPLLFTCILDLLYC